MAIQQTIFALTTTSGAKLMFAVMGDGRCAILRDSDIVETHSSEDPSLGRAIKRYFKLIDQCGGARRAFSTTEHSTGT